MRKHSDYNSYLTNLKQTNLGNYLSNNHYNIITKDIKKINTIIDTDYLKKTQHLYITENPTFRDVSLAAFNTFILQPIDLTTNYFSIFNLQANEQNVDGLVKNITNTCIINKNKNIYIYSLNNSNNLGGFNNLGTLYNCYIFPCNGDNLELLWDSINQNWSVQKYGGLFFNYMK